MKSGDNRAVFTGMVFLLVCVSAFAYFFVPSGHITGPIAPIEKAKEPLEETASRSKVGNRRLPTVPDAKKKIVVETPKETSKELKIEKEAIAGWVTITDPWGKEINRFRAGLAGNGWLALPVSACLGGNNWYFEYDSGREERISGGLWVNGDKVGLWHLLNVPDSFDGLGFGPWDEDKPVSWKSIESVNEYHLIKLYSYLADGYFVSALLPDNIDENGVFIQDDNIVGWSFGKSRKGFMWPGNEGKPLKYRTWVTYFYNITFANGREEKFASALAIQQGHTGLAQLASFIEGFRLQPKLSLEDTPDHLLPEEIIKRMRAIVINAMHLDERSKVVNMLSSQILKQIGDIGLFIDIVPAIAAAHGFEAAIIAIEDTGADIVRQMGREAPELNRLQRDYYQNWLRSVITDGDVARGLKIYTGAKYYYPDDPDIHLLGVEMELMSGNWEGAERLLYMRNYPAAFQTRFQLLARRISDMKGQDEKIVIRFRRGSHSITVTAAVNGSIDQSFMVDTGATIVTIPSSTADALGLDITYGHNIISTVGGPIKAGEVMIDAIEIDGWVEYDIKAYVVDIPDRPGLGLLGLNYLGRFQMDLRPEEGVLLLSPR